MTNGGCITRWSDMSPVSGLIPNGRLSKVRKTVSTKNRTYRIQYVRETALPKVRKTGLLKVQLFGLWKVRKPGQEQGITRKTRKGTRKIYAHFRAQGRLSPPSHLRKRRRPIPKTSTSLFSRKRCSRHKTVSRLLRLSLIPTLTCPQRSSGDLSSRECPFRKRSLMTGQRQQRSPDRT